MGQPHGTAHDQRRHNGTQQIFHNGGGMGDDPLDGDQIQRCDADIADQAADGGAKNADVGIARQDEHRRQLQNAANEHIDHRQIHMAVGLQQRIGHQDHRIKHDTSAQNGHQIGGHSQPLAGVSAQNRHHRLCHHHQSHRTGCGDQGGDSGSGFRCLLGSLVIFLGQQGGDGRNGADGNGGDEGAGHIVNLLCKVVDAFLHIGLFLGHGFQQAAHVGAGLQHRQELQSRRANGDGHRDGQQTFGNGLAAFPFLPGQGHGLIAFPEAKLQIQRRHQTAGCHAQNGSSRRQRIVIRQLQHHNGTA